MGVFFCVLEGVPALERRTSRTGWREGGYPVRSAVNVRANIFWFTFAERFNSDKFARFLNS